MNPSTRTRVERLSRLVAELAKSKLSSGDAAVLLGCSNSGARVYLLELSDAGVVHSISEPVQRGRHRTAYALNENSAVVEDYLRTLARCTRSISMPVEHNRAATRDPLMNALFGTG